MSKLTIFNNPVDQNLAVIKVPQYQNVPKYAKFKNFLENKVESERSWPVCAAAIDALELVGLKVQINLTKCIGCMACLSTVKSLNHLIVNKKEILEQIYPKDVMTKLKKGYVFNGQLFQLSFFPYAKTKTFSEFTSTNEKKHLSLWSASILNFLCSSENSRIGKEIEIMNASNLRDGRLDVCIDSNNFILVGEAKTDLDSLLAENRYRLQIPNYTKECLRFITDYNVKNCTNKQLIIFLIVGGDESDLLPENHFECSSRSGNKSKRFYDDLVKQKIKFVSADAILLLMIYSIYTNKRICFDLLMNKITNDDFIGLTTAGIIMKKKNEIVVNKLDEKLINSVAKPFF